MRQTKLNNIHLSMLLVMHHLQLLHQEKRSNAQSVKVNLFIFIENPLSFPRKGKIETRASCFYFLDCDLESSGLEVQLEEAARDSDFVEGSEASPSAAKRPKTDEGKKECPQENFPIHFPH